MVCCVPGASPSQMMATWSARLARCRSMQLAEMLRTPSSYHLIETSGYLKEVFLILVGGLIQSRRLACSAQKPSGSLTERAYIWAYFSGVTKVRARISAL